MDWEKFIEIKGRYILDSHWRNKGKFADFPKELKSYKLMRKDLRTTISWDKLVTEAEKKTLDP